MSSLEERFKRMIPDTREVEVATGTTSVTSRSLPPRISLKPKPRQTSSQKWLAAVKERKPVVFPEPEPVAVPVALELKPKFEVRAVAAEALSLEHPISQHFGVTVDGVDLANNDRVLLCNELESKHNGVWIVKNPGIWERTTVPENCIIFINEGRAYAGSQWIPESEHVFNMEEHFNFAKTRDRWNSMTQTSSKERANSPGAEIDDEYVRKPPKLDNIEIPGLSSDRRQKLDVQLAEVRAMQLKRYEESLNKVEKSQF